MRSAKVYDQSYREGGGSQAVEGGIEITYKSITAGSIINLCSYSLNPSLLSAAIRTQDPS